MVRPAASSLSLLRLLGGMFMTALAGGGDVGENACRMGRARSMYFKEDFLMDFLMDLNLRVGRRRERVDDVC